MFWKNTAVFVFLLFILSTKAWGNIRIREVNLSNDATKATITIKHDGRDAPVPELKVEDKMIQLAIPEGVVWPKIEKKVSTAGGPFDTTLMAYQYTKELARFRAILPYSVENMKEQVSVTLKDGIIILSFPRPAQAAVVSPAPKVKKKEEAPRKVVEAKRAPAIDREMLEEILGEKGAKEYIEEDGLKDTVAAAPAEDKVKSVLSAPKKEPKKNSNSFSFLAYGGKFVAFLVLVLGIFYAAVSLLKKGVLKKGKLALLGRGDMVTVLSSTHIGPKKSLMVVRAYDQVFLLASSEAGVQMVSELSNVPGVLKDGEKKIAGTNFDDFLGTEKTKDKEFRLKGEDKPATEVEEKKNRLADQIKDKVKALKPLQ